MTNAVSSRKDIVSMRQIMAAAFIGLLSPLIRLLPQIIPKDGSLGAWLAPVAAAIPAALYVVLIFCITRRRSEGEGLAELFIRMLGKPVGKAVCVIYGLWFVFYAGFLLRTGAERMLSSVYTGGDAWVFMVITLAAALIAASGRVCSLMRTAEVYVIIIAAVLVIIVVCSVGNIKAENLFPVTYRDTGSILMASLPVLNVCAAYFYFWFLGGRVKKTPGELKTALRWLIVLLVAAFAILIMVCGAFPSGYLKNLQNPFFIVIRNITILSILERFEAVVIALWVVSDFVFLSVLFMVNCDICGAVTGKSRKLPVLAVMGAAALAAGIIMSPDAFELTFISEVLVPMVNMGLAFVLLPLCFIVGKLRKKV